jgi:outer membrane beta-barrel protein
MKKLFSVSLLIVLTFAQIAQAEGKKNLKEEFQTLGDNEEVVDRVRKLDTQQRVRVVQNRLVDRNNRLELSVNMGGVTGGDSYVTTYNTGANLQYHITPRWSLGVEYSKATNKLTDEGKRQYDAAYEAQKNDPESPQRFPAVDFPIDTKMATISFYPVYGKLNLFDWSIAQFDLYTLLGYGSKKMNSGETPTYAAGLGSGFWLNNYLTARLEIRYEKYKDLLQSAQRDQESVSGTASLGIMIW